MNGSAVGNLIFDTFLRGSSNFRMANSYELVNRSICFPMYTEANELLSSLNGVTVGNLIFSTCPVAYQVKTEMFIAVTLYRG